MNNTDQNLLLKIYGEVKEIKRQVQKIPEIEKQVQKIPEIEKQVQKIPEIEKQVQKIPEIETQLQEIPKIKQELRNISGSVARIEVEHGEKLVALFDAFKVNTEKIEKQDKRITKCEKIVDKHDDQIYILNSKTQNT